MNFAPQYHQLNWTLLRFDDVDEARPATHWRDPGLVASARWANLNLRGWCDVTSFRYNFLMSSSGLSSLQIERLQRGDGGLYRWSPGWPRLTCPPHIAVTWNLSRSGLLTFKLLTFSQEIIGTDTLLIGKDW